jgi:hypothetical protein
MAPAFRAADSHHAAGTRVAALHASARSVHRAAVIKEGVQHFGNLRGVFLSDCRAINLRDSKPYVTNSL